MENWQQQLIYLLRVAVGGVLGLVIGIERSHRQKEAGMATHFTVGLASTLFTIFFRRESLHGLTTAAGIWATAAVGMCVGSGMYIVSVSVTIIIIVVQIVLHTKPLRRHNQRLLLVKFVNTNEMMDKLKTHFGVNNFSRFKVRRADGRFEAEAVVRPVKSFTADEISAFVADNPEVLSVERLEDL